MSERPQPVPERIRSAILVNLRTGKEYALSDVTTLGRMRKCDVTISDDSVSRYHARIIRSSGAYLLEDLESRNGTYLEGERVHEPKALRDGCRIVIGNATFIFSERPARYLAAEQVGPAVVFEDASTPRLRLSIQVADYDARQMEDEHAGISPSARRSFGEAVARLRSARSTEMLVGELAKEILRVFSWADHCVVALRESGSAGLAAKAEERRRAQDSEPIRISRPIVDQAIARGCAVILEEDEWEGAEGEEEITQDLAFRMGMCVPLLVPDRAMGVVHIDALRTVADIGKGDLVLATLIAHEAAALMDGIQIFERTRRERDAFREENARLRDRVAGEWDFSGIAGASKWIKQAIAEARRAAGSSANTLIRGERGTGRELFARTIHCNSARRSGPFVRVSCSTSAPDALEGLLFGVEESSAGEVKRQAGRVEAADLGVLFLDEVADLPPAAQAKLLEALEEGETRRLGGSDAIKVNLRVIAATRKDLAMEVREGRFREDLCRCLSAVVIELPALSQRVEDVPLLATHFLGVLGREMNKRVKGFARGAMAALQRHAWPGNARELRNVVEWLVLRSAADAIVEERDVVCALHGRGDEESTCLDRGKAV